MLKREKFFFQNIQRKTPRIIFQLGNYKMVLWCVWSMMGLPTMRRQSFRATAPYFGRPKLWRLKRRRRRRRWNSSPEWRVVLWVGKIVELQQNAINILTSSHHSHQMSQLKRQNDLMLNSSQNRKNAHLQGKLNPLLVDSDGRFGVDWIQVWALNFRKPKRSESLKKGRGSYCRFFFQW